jgi:hypothetical protein
MLTHTHTHTHRSHASSPIVERSRVCRHSTTRIHTPLDQRHARRHEGANAVTDDEITDETHDENGDLVARESTSRVVGVCGRVADVGGLERRVV